MSAQHTPGPWEFVPANEHHGPYITSDFGSTIADCYAMSNPLNMSVLNGGDSKPVLFLHEMAAPNARLIAAAPDLLAALQAANAYYGPFGEITVNNNHDEEDVRVASLMRAAIAKATS
jgi:hypothetical protein